MIETPSPVRSNVMKLLLILVTASFLFLTIFLINTQHFSRVQLVGLSSALLGFLFSVHSLLLPSAKQKLLIGFFILSLFGGLGVYEHYEADKTRVALNEVRLQLAGTSETNSQSGGPPLIAPLALSGLAIMMIILLFVDGNSSKTSTKFVPAGNGNRWAPGK